MLMQWVIVSIICLTSINAMTLSWYLDRRNRVVGSAAGRGNKKTEFQKAEDLMWITDERCEQTGFEVGMYMKCWDDCWRYNHLVYDYCREKCQCVPNQNRLPNAIANFDHVQRWDTAQIRNLYEFRDHFFGDEPLDGEN